MYLPIFCMRESKRYKSRAVLDHVFAPESHMRFISRCLTLADFEFSSDHRPVIYGILRQIAERAIEFKTPVCCLLVDYKGAFDALNSHSGFITVSVIHGPWSAVSCAYIWMLKPTCVL